GAVRGRGDAFYEKATATMLIPPVPSLERKWPRPQERLGEPETMTCPVPGRGGGGGRRQMPRAEAEADAEGGGGGRSGRGHVARGRLARVHRALARSSRIAQDPWMSLRVLAPSAVASIQR